jgi:hypothetical protein
MVSTQDAGAQGGDRLVASSRQWASVFLLAWVLYAVTANWQSSQISDAYGAAWAGWQLVDAGDFDVSQSAGFRDYPGVWTIEIAGETRISRTIGVILAGVPGHVLLAWTGASATTSATLATTLLTAAALANLSVTLRTLADRRTVLFATLVLGAGTAMWTVAADQLWTHGLTPSGCPAQCWPSHAVTSGSPVGR